MFLLLGIIASCHCYRYQHNNNNSTNNTDDYQIPHIYNGTTQWWLGVTTKNGTRSSTVRVSYRIEMLNILTYHIDIVSEQWSRRYSISWHLAWVTGDAHKHIRHPTTPPSCSTIAAPTTRYQLGTTLLMPSCCSFVSTGYNRYESSIGRGTAWCYFHSS